MRMNLNSLIAGQRRGAFCFETAAGELSPTK